MNESLQQVYLIRHGETEWSLSGQHTGITDIALTDNGRRTAEQFAPVLTKMDFALVLTSPLIRARTTCELAGLGDSAENDRNLMEWNYGDYEGLTSKQIQTKRPGWNLFRDGCPNGENPEQVGNRANHMIAKIRATEGNVLLFAHGHILRVLAVRWLGFPVMAGVNFMLDTATMSILSYYRGFPVIKQWNATFSGE